MKNAGRKFKMNEKENDEEKANEMINLGIAQKKV